jgi:hypothetical protein
VQATCIVLREAQQNKRQMCWSDTPLPIRLQREHPITRFFVQQRAARAQARADQRLGFTQSESLRPLVLCPTLEDDEVQTEQLLLRVRNPKATMPFICRWCNNYHVQKYTLRVLNHINRNHLRAYEKDVLPEIRLRLKQKKTAKALADIAHVLTTKDARPGVAVSPAVATNHPAPSANNPGAAVLQAPAVALPNASAPIGGSRGTVAADIAAEAASSNVNNVQPNAAKSSSPAQQQAPTGNRRDVARVPKQHRKRQPNAPAGKSFCNVGDEELEVQQSVKRVTRRGRAVTRKHDPDYLTLRSSSEG